MKTASQNRETAINQAHVRLLQTLLLLLPIAHWNTWSH